MLIDVLTKSRKQGYIGRQLPGALPYFSNNNLCLRRRSLVEIGLYDPNCRRCEDVDLCAKIARSSWLMFLCDDMITHHRARTSFRQLLLQWWGYGRYVPYVFKKHNSRCWEVFYQRGSGGSAGGAAYGQLFFADKMPFSLCIFVTPFLMVHIAMAGLVWCLLCFPGWLCLVSFLVFAFSFCLYLAPDFASKEEKVHVKMSVALVRYLTNLAFFSAHLFGGLRHGIVYLPPVICQRQPLVERPAGTLPRNPRRTRQAEENLGAKNTEDLAVTR
jgi:cellulose synthase/poly-beta-1,6-N-acetylglucosamine synthase-like glycosyltransferase